MLVIVVSNGLLARVYVATTIRIATTVSAAVRIYLCIVPLLKFRSYACAA